MPVLPITPADLHRLMDEFPEAATQVSSLELSDDALAKHLTNAMFRNGELVRHLVAIARGLPVDEIKPGAFLNPIVATACLAVTAQSSHAPELVQIFVDRLGLGAPLKVNPLRLVVDNDA